MANSPIDPAETLAAPEGRPGRVFVQDLLDGLARLAVLALVAAAVLQRLRGLHWAADLTTHMQAHLLLAAVAVTLYYLWARRWAWLTLALALVLLGALTVRPWQFWMGPAEPPLAEAAEAAPTDGVRPLRILVWNAFVHNPDPQSLVRFVARRDADVVAILEWTPALGRELDGLRQSHPHHREVPFGGAFGIAMYSRIPGTIEAVTIPGPVPALRFRPQDPRLPVDLWAVHTLPPTGREYQAIRDEQLRWLGTHLREGTQRMPILGGDLNITPWADQYQRLLGEADLVDSQAGFGYHATWPNRLGRFGIPIDHVAVDRHIEVTARSVHFASPGSDHAAVWVELAVSGRSGIGF